MLGWLCLLSSPPLIASQPHNFILKLWLFIIYHIKTKDWFKTRLLNSFYVMSLFETLKLLFVYLYIFELCFPPVLILPLDYVFHLAQNVHGNYSKLDVNKYILSENCNIIGLIEPITRFGDLEHATSWST